ncbi:hypothetical protein J2S02_002496 [Metabacillus niabensis]|uniref:Uncharacterized protein n=1 Tax=Metabacillus niabensis TaxID=324854 RepID=A0ABT9Z1M3_9BACI|nr:hypothetical protein [Metabacillus niabensis]
MLQFYTYEESSEAMNNTAFAISSALPNRYNGVSAAKADLSSSGIIGVSMKPGHNAFIRIFCSAYSSASERVRLIF